MPNFVLLTALHEGENDTDELLLNVTEYDIIMLAFSSFFVIVICEYRVMLPDNPCDLKECIF